MILPERIRSDIADRLIRIVIPPIVGVCVVSFPATYYFAPHQHHRLFMPVVALIFLLPVWIFTKKGKPLIGSAILVVGFLVTIIASMYFSGGIHAPGFRGVLSMIAVVICIYGITKAIIFLGFIVSIGCIFIVLEHQQMLPLYSTPSSSFLLIVTCLWLIISLVFFAIPIVMLQKALVAKDFAEKERQSILDKSPDIIYRLDTEGRFTFISDAVRKYGYTPDGLIGRPLTDLVHPNDQPFVMRRLLERRSGKRGSRDTEVRMLKGGSESDPSPSQAKHHTWLTFLVSSHGLYSDDPPTPKTYIGVQGIARDVSKIRYFEQQVDRLAAVVEQAAEDVIITDTDGAIQYVNPRFEQVTGYLKSDVIGKNPRIFKSGKHDEAFYRQLWETVTKEDIWKGQIWNKRKDGGLILQDVTITPIFDAMHKLTGYASVRRDITEQFRIQEQLQQAQKMEAIGTLAGGIAHDFNNILAGMMGYTELAICDCEASPSTREKLERVLKAGDRASELVKQILSFSRSHKKQVSHVSPHAIAEEVLKLMRASLPATIEIKQAIKSESCVLADETNIHQVLMNLCTNAAHAMKQSGGVLRVGLENVALNQQALAHQKNVIPGDFIKICVEDTGIGMSPEILSKAFDPFFTTKELGEGTGMGLATVQGIIHELGGFISLSSEPNRGTAVHVYIPLIPEPAEVDAGMDQQLATGGTEHVMVVDDEQMQAELIKEALSRKGYHVTAFSDSTVAMMHFQQNSDAYDIVITDMTMPKMTGDLLVQKIHLKRTNTPVIMCTGFSDIMDEKKARALGINALLYKPVIISKLLETIRKVLNQNGRMSRRGTNSCNITQ